MRPALTRVTGGVFRGSCCTKKIKIEPYLMKTDENPRDHTVTVDFDVFEEYVSFF